MPDKHSNNNKPRISEELIRKYLAGELDDKAMHALERQALDDPFLADALEGYAAYAPDQSANLADLEGRLDQRLEQGRRGRIKLMYARWASAAAILVVLGASFLWINRQQRLERTRDIARSEAAQGAASRNAADSAAVAVAPAPVDTASVVAAETMMAKADAPAKRTTPQQRAEASDNEERKANTAAVPETDLSSAKSSEDVALAKVQPAPKAAARSQADTIDTSMQFDVALNMAPASQHVVAGRPRATKEVKLKQSAYAAATARGIRIVILGSSTAEGVGPKSRDSSWAYLFNRYVQARNPRNTVVNLGVGGYTSYKILPDDADIPFYKPDPDPAHNITKALSLHPDLIIINMPTNDIADGYSVEEYQRNLATVTDIIRQHHIPFYITTTQPRNTSASKRQKLREMRDIIIRNYPDTYINCWEGLSTPDGNIDPRYNSGDGVHLNGQGHLLMFDRIKEKVIFP
jgi:lysophospholipase L1-like esterase/cytoskeletal protein RodZ